MLAGALFVAGCRGRSPSISYAQFVDGLLDPERPARLDTPQAELVGSVDPTGGNDDFNNFAGIVGTNWAILADLTGPGTVTRFWTTGGADDQQRLQFYFDGERKPRIDATLADLRQGRAPFLTALSRRQQSCWFSYAPLPFQKSLKILAETGNFTHEGWPRLFYQVNYSRLPPGTAVPRFPEAFTDDDVAALQRFGLSLNNEPLPAARGGLTNRMARSTIPAGGAAEVLTLTGPAVLRDLSLRVLTADGTAADRRALTLEIAWDDQPEPSVATPFDAFFGRLWGAPDYASAYLMTSGATVRCRWPMPFQKGARVVVRNGGSQPVAVEAEGWVRPMTSWNPAMGYLHASWHHSTPANLGRPHVVVHAVGRGKIVGCLLGDSSATPSWWALEGDETIRIDSENVPGWRGTGLEDYFNGGWYYKNNLVMPTHGLVFKRPFVTIQYRFHRDDARRFEQSADMVFERGPDQMSPATMASVGYFYLGEPSPAGSDALGPAAGDVPADEYEAAALMTTLCNFERLGDYVGASACIDRHLAGGDTPDAEILRLRQIAYRERLEGFPVARPLYEAFLQSTTNEPAVSYARLLLWFHESPDHALLSLNCGLPTRVYLDGVTVGEVGHPQAFVVQPITLAPGRHVLAMQAFRGPQPEWVQAGLRTHSGVIGTAKDWRFAFDPAGNWRNDAVDMSAWKPTGDSVQEGPPPLPYVATQPHPFVDLQSIPWGIWANAVWPPEGKTVGFRQEFDIP